MKNNIHLFEVGKAVKNEEILSKLGIRGRQAMELAGLGLPIVPGFILDSEVSFQFKEKELDSELSKHITWLESKTGKKFNSNDKPLLLKVVVSPNLQLQYPSIHNLGLTSTTIKGFGAFTGNKFALGELFFLMKGLLSIEKKIAEGKEATKDLAEIEKKITAVKTAEDKLKTAKIDTLDGNLDSYFSICAPLVPADVFTDSKKQLIWALGRIKELLNIEENADGVIGNNETAVLVQPMVYGNFGKNSAFGEFYTRNEVTGEKVLHGEFARETFDEKGGQKEEINKLEKVHLDELKKVADKVEKLYKEIRKLRFTVEAGKLWMIEQRVVDEKSTRADIRLLLDLLKEKIVNESYVINAVKPSQLNELLHPVINPASTKGLKKIVGGIAGAPGAAIGRIYFSTDSLIKAYREAQKNGGDTRVIFCQEATYASDVKAVEMSQGVLSSHGGYAAHASVVARQYGKVSLVLNEETIKYKGTTAVIGGEIVKEGDYVSVNVPYYGDSTIYFGKAATIQSDPEASGLMEFLEVVKKNMPSFHVRANADRPDDAALALKLGAEGIGLCRTEHMFFNEKRINVFREMIMSSTKDERVKVLAKLKKFQKEDFYELLKIMKGKEVIIRLLDPPLHEFLPHTDEEIKKFIEYLSPTGAATAKGAKKSGPTSAEVREKIDFLAESNPMLGHRGSRLAITYPEIYETQVQALVEAAYELKKEGIETKPEIMLPIIMNENELKVLVFGKKIEGLTYRGLTDVINETAKQYKDVKPIDFKIGTMIELPVAALGAGKLAKYAEFFSFGTNDLTQTTLGISRDDFNSFMPDYTLLDVLAGNPFKDLDPQVKELIQMAVKRGKMTRPGITKGLCGEHGAIPENIQFCIEAGLDYVSCSPYSVPLACLAIAQYALNNK